jgi:hypothetical protein
MPIVAPNSRRRSLRIADAMSVVVAAIGLLVRPLITTIIDPCLYRSIIDGSRSYRGVNLDSCLFLCLAVVVGVIEDDYLAITRRPEDVVVEIAKKLSDDFLIVSSINNKRGGLKHWDLPGGVALLGH